MTMMEKRATWYSELSAVKCSSLPITIQKYLFSEVVVVSYCDENSGCFLYLKFLNFSSSITWCFLLMQTR